MKRASTSARGRADELLGWYDRHRRALPWRAPPGERADPYRVWLSEIMLQQTGVKTVAPYFSRFVERWPTVEALAAAPLDDILAAWAGLGYYARARRLHACARHVAGALGGRFPDDAASLRELPGIGAYTAGAVAAIAFGRREAAVDGNAERVIARLDAIEAPLPGAAGAIRARALALTPQERPGDFVQALMDLGATVCAPRRPACGLCPWRGACLGRRLGLAETLPRKAPGRARPLRHGLVFWLERADGAALLRKRPPEGLLGGMLEAPSTPWRETPWRLEEARAHAPCPAPWRLLEGAVRHGFTHFAIELKVAAGLCGASAPQGEWHGPEAFGGLALPTLTRKVARHALAARAASAATGRNDRR